MNPSIKKLAEVAKKPVKTIIGLMSGTSLDGLDIAWCEISGSGGETSVELKQFETVSYDPETKKRLKQITSVPQVSLEDVCLMHSWLGDHHGKLILDTLKKWQLAPSEIDCVASHGQSIYHAPIIQHNKQGMPNATLQIGDGDHIARKTGIITVSDFRQKHTATGGEGAPMVSFVDRILFTHDTEERILLNIGGIANFTYLPAKSHPENQSVTSDTGPGNTLIDAATQKHFSQDFDENGVIAKSGAVNQVALDAFKSDPYFKKPLPKTTGPEVFNLDWISKHFKKAGIDELSPDDLVATLTRLSAETIAETIKSILSDDQAPSIYLSGGGMHNPVLVKWLEELLPEYEIQNFEKIGFNPDAKEAVLFAVLANEMLSGEGFPVGQYSLSSKLNFGKISFPS